MRIDVGTFGSRTTGRGGGRVEYRNGVSVFVTHKPKSELGRLAIAIALGFAIPIGLGVLVLAS